MKEQSEKYAEKFNDSSKDKEDKDIKALKADIQDILKRVSNLKDKAKDSFFEEAGDLMSKFSEMKDAAQGKAKDATDKIKETVQCGVNSAEHLASYAKESPITAAICCFSLGLIFAMLFKK